MKAKLTYKMFTKGVVVGWIGYELQLTEKRLSNEKIADIIMMIQQHRRELKRPIPVVKLLGPFPSTEIMIKMLKPLRDYKYYLIAEVEGSDGFLTWYTLLNGICVKLKGIKWPVYSCTELWYTPERCVEPPLIHEPKPPTLYLDLAEITEEVDYFFTGSKYVWNILSEVPTRYVKELLEV